MGMDHELAFNSTERVFKGGLVEGGAPFTRDISYLKNMLEIFVLVSSLANVRRSDYIEQLFNGYVTMRDLPVLIDLQNRNFLLPPKHVPEIFRKENLNKLKKMLSQIQILDMTS
jgi:hypothetical protein